MTAEQEITTFSILRRGATEPGGPYSEEQILAMLRQDQISRKDYVFFEGMADWRPIEDVFEIHETINHFIDDGQDGGMAAKAFSEINNLVSEGEEIYYIAIQSKAGILTKTRQSLVVSSLHLYHLTEKKVGFEIEAHPWSSLSDWGGEPGSDNDGTFCFMVDGKRRVDIPNLPIGQIHRVVELAGEMKR